MGALDATVERIAYTIATAIELVAVLVIAVGVVEAIAGIVRLVPERGRRDERRRVWLRLARWLVAGLTFQLAADVVHTTVAPTWDEIGRVAAIAVIRTFLTFFLDRDIQEVFERREPLAPGEPSGSDQRPISPSVAPAARSDRDDGRTRP